MADDTHYFNIKFGDIIVTKSESEITIATGTTDSLKCKATLVYTTFNRKVYQPNEIVADICFSDSKVQKYLSFFFNAKVELICYANNGVQETFTGFYVYDALPLKKPNTDLYIRFHIYSLDHQLTLKKYSRTYVAKKLFANILSPQGYCPKNSELKFPLTVADITETIKIKVKNKEGVEKEEEVTYHYLDHLYYGDKYNECIQPYLVQYNESFYDFMVRTANRCGEFFFWDDGKLRLGRSCKDGAAFAGSNCTVYSKNTNTNVESDSYQSDFFSLDNLNREKDFKSDVSSVDDIKKKIDPDYSGGEYQYLCFGNDEGDLKPDLSTNTHYYNNEVNQDVYRTRLYRDRFDSLYHETVGNAIKYGTSFVSMLLNSTSLFDFLRKFTLSNVLMTSVAAAQWGQTDKYGNNHFLEDKKLDKKEDARSNDEERQVKKNGDIVYSNLFTASDTKGHLTNKNFYNIIRRKEEYLSRNQITFNTTTPQLVRLGQTFIYESTQYVIIQIKMKLGTNESKFSDIDAASEAEFQGLGSLMQVIAIPIFYEKKLDKEGNPVKVDDKEVWDYAVYPPMHPAGHVRRSEPQVAVVADYFDPHKRGRVRIKYPWQGKDDTEASPWIRVLTPSATPDSGCSFELEEGDEVLVEYESDNIERPYVAGTLYNKFNHAPFIRGDMALISKNGHGIAFDDPIDYSKFIAGISPSYSFVNQFLAIDASDWKKSRRLTGGTTISDAYGFYKIELSTDQRKIDIKSPFGWVNIDAFQGINICAPNGDINIKGQNINIEAGNAIKVTSGTNIEKKGYFGDLSGMTFLKNLGDSLGGAVLDYLSPMLGLQVVDIDLLRKIIQVFLRPIDGTLEIKSHQYLILEAGEGEALPKSDRYKVNKASNRYDKFRIAEKQQQGAQSSDVIGLCGLIPMISMYTDAVIDAVMPRYKALKSVRGAFDKARTKALKAQAVNQGCATSANVLNTIKNNLNNPNSPRYNGPNAGDLQRNGQNQDSIFNALVTAADAMVQPAKDFFTALDNIQPDIEGQLNVIPNSDSSKGQYYNTLLPAIRDATLRANIVQYFNNQFDITDEQVNVLRKKIKHAWFAVCLRSRNAGGGNGLSNVNAGTQYSWGAIGHDDNWAAYVNGITLQNAIEKSSAAAFGDKVLDLTIRQWSDMFMDVFYDWNHWEAGKPGRILLSDSPLTTYYLSRNNGLTNKYTNDRTYVQSYSMLKIMLNDL